MNKVITYILAVIMILGAAGHIFYPDSYTGMIPEFISDKLAHILAAISELAIGLALLIPKLRKYGGLGLMILMIIFMPLHIWDVVREDPFMGSATAAWIRFFVQAFFIAGGWWVWDRFR